MLAGGTTRIEDAPSSVLAAPRQSDARFAAVDHDPATYWLGRVRQPVRVRFKRPVYLVGVHVIPPTEASLARPERVELASGDLTLAEDTMPNVSEPHFVEICREVDWFDFTVVSAHNDSGQAAIGDLEFEVPRR